MENHAKKAGRGNVGSVLLRYDAISDLFFARISFGQKNKVRPLQWVHKSGKLDVAIRILATHLHHSPYSRTFTLENVAFDDVILGALLPVTERITILRRLRLIRCSLSATGRELLAPSVSQLIRGFASIRSVSIEGQGFQASQLNGSVIRACIAKGVRALSFPAGMPCTYISEYAILDFCFDANAVSSNLPTRRRLEIWQPRISTRLIENFVEQHMTCKDDIRFAVKIYSTDLAKQELGSVQEYLRRNTNDHFEMRIAGKRPLRIRCQIAETTPCMQIVRGETDRGPFQ